MQSGSEASGAALGSIASKKSVLHPLPPNSFLKTHARDKRQRKSSRGKNTISNYLHVAKTKRLREAKRRKVLFLLLTISEASGHGH